jgi:hypothetical protein
MRFVSTREATALTGLSTDHLREWTSRRALIPADLQHRGHGSPAQYAWQTILLIRIAVALRNRFRIELQRHRGLFSELRAAFAETSFIALWGRSLAIYDASTWVILEPSEGPDHDTDAIIIRLDPHLAVLSLGFTLPGPNNAGQLELFPARGVENESSTAPASAGTNPQERVHLQRPRRRA